MTRAVPEKHIINFLWPYVAFFINRLIGKISCYFSNLNILKTKINVLHFISSFPNNTQIFALY